MEVFKDQALSFGDLGEQGRLILCSGDESDFLQFHHEFFDGARFGRVLLVHRLLERGMDNQG